MTDVLTETEVTNILGELRLIGMHAGVVTGVSAVVIPGVRVGMLSDEIIAGTAAVIGTEFIGEAVVTAKVLTTMRAGAMIGDAHGSKTEVKPSGLPAALAALEFSVPESSNKPFPCC